MLVEGQKIEIKWNNNNREWYENLGYNYTKRYDAFIVNEKELSTGSTASVECICDYCGEKYKTKYYNYVIGKNKLDKDCCKKCAQKKANEIVKIKKGKEKFQQLKKIAEENDYTILTKEEEYSGARTKIEYICPIHGKQSGMIDNLIHGYGCKKCGREIAKEKVKTDSDYIEEVINSKNNNILLNKKEFESVIKRNLKIKCACGEIFTTSFVNYTDHGVNKCRKCSRIESKGEELVRKYLDNNKIPYIQEKRFEDCRDNKPLPFDFFLPNHNVCIEYNGVQHYKNVKHFGGEKACSKRKKHDEIKNIYCYSKGIELITIPYWDKENIELILKEKIK